MPHILLTKTLPYSKKQLFELVADIKSYQDYVPWCEKSVIVKQEDAYLWADVTVGYKHLNKVFRSKVHLDLHHDKIVSQLVSGPLKHLDQTWHFVKQEQQTQVIFDMEYEFDSLVLHTIMAGFSHYFAETMMQAFVDRAKVKFG